MSSKQRLLHFPARATELLDEPHAVTRARRALEDLLGVPSARRLLERIPPNHLAAAAHLELAAAGLSDNQIGTLRAAFSLAAATIEISEPTKVPIGSPHDLVELLRFRGFASHEQEIFGAVFLDGPHRVISVGEVFRGTRSRAAVDPAAVLKRALLADAHSFIVFHCHPSGDPSPSQKDISFTHRLVEAGRLVGIPMRDHLIITPGTRWRSLKRMGVL